MLRILKQYFPIRNIVFVMMEGGIIFFAVLLAFAVVTDSNVLLVDMLQVFRIVLVTVTIQVCLYYNDLYDFCVSSSVSEIMIRLFQSLGGASLALAAIYLMFPATMLDHRIFALSLFFLAGFIVVWRLAYRHILNKGVFNQKIMVLGSGDLSKDICREILENIDCGYSVSVLIPDIGDPTDLLDNNLPIVIKSPETSLLDLARAFQIKKVVVALAEMRSYFPAKELIECRTGGIDIMEGSSFYERLTGKVLVTQINPSWLIFSKGFKKSWINVLTKRMEDMVLSLVLLVGLLPLLLVVAACIKLDSRGPLFFVQKRVGLNKKEYEMHKFRSMCEDAERMTGPVWASENDRRITRVGRFIRRFRIDELPQLWDVLMGRMSLVGPRPERKYFTEALEAQIPYYSQRFHVKPGVTGWAQVSYNYGASVEDAVEKLNYELFYVKNMSLAMDVIIILRTIKTVLFGKGVR